MAAARTAGRIEEHAIQRALEQFRAVLQRHALRMTPVREAILRAALTQAGHFDVDDLVRELQGKNVREASMATVYRVIPLLVEAGLLQPTLLSQGERHRYEAAFEREHHDHLICTLCGKVVEFHFEAFEMLQREIAAKYGFELTTHVHELLGRCDECRQRPPGPAGGALA
jgi:Fur family transcriptional regulator, ferric uptake regulator